MTWTRLTWRSVFNKWTFYPCQSRASNFTQLLMQHCTFQKFYFSNKTIKKKWFWSKNILSIKDGDNAPDVKYLYMKCDTKNINNCTSDSIKLIDQMIWCSCWFYLFVSFSYNFFRRINSTISIVVHNVCGYLNVWNNLTIFLKCFVFHRNTYSFVYDV